MQFRCYALIDPFPDGAKEPINYCIVGDDRLFIGPALDYCKEEVLNEYPRAQFVEDCGWVFLNEEDKLLDIETQILLEDNKNVPKAP
jgi:hypothetical protein